LHKNNIVDFYRSEGQKKPEEKEFLFKNSKGLECVFYAQAKQGGREYQEDRHLMANFTISAKENKHLEGTYTLISVFDGHGGSFCASWLSRVALYHLIEIFQEDSSVYLPSALYRYFERLNEEWDNISKVFDDGSGSTHTMWLFNHESEKQYFANLGDSRTIALDLKKRQLVFETSDHDFSEKEMVQIQKRSDEMQRVSNGRERIDITHNGGVHRIEGILALSRAHGDNIPDLFVPPYGHKVGKVPDVFFAARFPGENDSPVNSVSQLVVVASDGIWDKCSSEDMLALATTTEKPNLHFLNNLVDAKTKDSEDNKTVIFMHLRRSDSSQQRSREHAHIR
jgi:serine/threonine protein phosphatase PrpC